jgi:hypothetical protein
MTMKEESETEDVEVEKEDIKPLLVVAEEHPAAIVLPASEEVTPVKGKRGRKAIVKSKDSGSELDVNKVAVEAAASPLGASTRSVAGTPTRDKQPPAAPVAPVAPSPMIIAKQVLTTPKGKQPPTRGGSRSSSRVVATASVASAEDEEDPYAFKEPKNLEATTSGETNQTII